MARKGNGHLLKKNKIMQATTSLNRAAIEAREKLTDVEGTVKRYAKSNPWKTMGISLLAGVIVGKIMNFHK